MELVELVREIEDAPPKRAERLVKRALAQPGFGEAYYAAILERLSAEPKLASRLARLWKSLAGSPAMRAHALRVKGLHERIQGNWVASAEAFQQAGAIAKTRADRALFQLGAIDSLGRAGRFEAAEALARKLVPQLRRAGLLNDAARVCVNAGNAALWQDDYLRASRWFDKAESLVSDAPYTLASAALGASTCALHLGAFDKAQSEAQRSAELLDGLHMPAYSAIARINLAQAHTLMGRPDAAVGRLLELRNQPLSDFDAMRLEEFLGDAYVQLNLYEEALDAYAVALRSPVAKRMSINSANCHLGAGDALHALGQRDGAIGRWTRAQRMYQRFGNALWAAVAQFRIGSAQGGPSGTRKTSSALETFRSRKNPFFEATALLDIVDGGKRGLTENKRHLARSAFLIRSFGLEGLMWRQAHLSARWSPRSPLPAYRKAIDEMKRSRALTESNAARSAHYRDKSQALGEFLSLLLARPTTQRIDEALRVIAEIRSASLIDEILSSTQLPIDGSLRDKLDELRREFAASQSTNAQPGTERRAHARPGDSMVFQRRWREMDRWLTNALPTTMQGASDALVFAETATGWIGLHRGAKIDLNIDSERLASDLRWLQFELTEPQIAPDVSSQRVERSLRDLKAQLWDPFAAAGPIRSICPDGALWQAPWRLFAALDGLDCEPEMALGPWKMGPDPIVSADRVVLWAFSAPGLDHLELEADALQRLFPHAELCRTVAEAKRSMESGPIDLLHVAAHASFHNLNPMFSSIVAAEDRILALDLARSPLRVDTVILSACDTGAMSLENRFEANGLTRAFLARGAKRVVATQWPLDDVAAFEFMNAMYYNVLDGISLSLALPSARQAVRQKFAHPYYWGAPLLFRGYDL